MIKGRALDIHVSSCEEKFRIQKEAKIKLTHNPVILYAFFLSLSVSLCLCVSLSRDLSELSARPQALHPHLHQPQHCLNTCCSVSEVLLWLTMSEIHCIILTTFLVWFSTA